MKKLQLLFMLLGLALPTLTFAQTKNDQAAAKLVETLERQRFEAQVKKDYTVLEKVFAEDLVYTHSNGKQNNKQEYIQSIRDGKSQYEKIDVEALNVRAYNDGKAAVVNGTITITLPPKPDGTPNLAHLKYVVVQIKDPKKGWQVVLWQSQKQPEAKS
ncbi:ketosteroid isomerase-like protein [Hymenobacter luteus]|uniref:Ketosteroid isomerase-like protein n=2 Tax=Hymenobacter TaxID=89966 RepID=A0A7W9T0E1_9BACT|nr:MULTISPECIES: nuclear transport factor 2 family protein [Hymenobacter]MBB4601113.1 ketosteroid isomerase-like protein [Hymenobacter latericoloratus]MBB6058680.1 ketosteroid isomerase-like protein [Hymenobacter luteus]